MFSSLFLSRLSRSLSIANEFGKYHLKRAKSIGLRANCDARTHTTPEPLPLSGKLAVARSIRSSIIWIYLDEGVYGAHSSFVRNRNVSTLELTA